MPFGIVLLEGNSRGRNWEQQADHCISYTQTSLAYCTRCAHDANQVIDFI